MKRLTAVAMFVLLLASVAVAQGAMYQGYPVVNVVVNGKPLSSEVPAINLNGTTLIPLRAVSEALGVAVEWDDSTQTAHIGVRQVIAPLTFAPPASAKASPLPETTAGSNALVQEALDNWDYSPFMIQKMKLRLAVYPNDLELNAALGNICFNRAKVIADLAKPSDTLLQKNVQELRKCALDHYGAAIRLNENAEKAGAKSTLIGLGTIQDRMPLLEQEIPLPAPADTLFTAVIYGKPDRESEVTATGDRWVTWYYFNRRGDAWPAFQKPNMAVTFDSNKKIIRKHEWE